MKISVLLPSLNAVKFICECVESILAQTLRDIEILCVDAGSTDGTLEILRRFEAMDSRVRVLLSEKKSYGYQVNMGIDAAAGKYIGIVEADDLILPEMYEELYQIAEEQEAELVKSDFYRFRDTPQERFFIVDHLTQEKSLYRHIIDISKEKACFRFPVNTWNGIYRKDFLDRYHIRHNETPGASFQDNGFWFQTFMHAERAYFIDKPYYMNRRDNDCSSVFDKRKVFCIAEEYRFIESLLRKDVHLFDAFQYEFTRACFVNYCWALRRVPYDSKRDFLSRFREDFMRFVQSKMLDTTMFSDEQLSFIFNVLYDHDAYFERNIRPNEGFYREIERADNIFIYGAGKIGRAFMDTLSSFVPPTKIRGFAVTSVEGNDESYHGMPVFAVDSLSDHRNHCLMIVAVGQRYHDEIVGHLRRLGFQKVVDMPKELI